MCKAHFRKAWNVTGIRVVKLVSTINQPVAALTQNRDHDASDEESRTPRTLDQQCGHPCSSTAAPAG